MWEIVAFVPIPGTFREYKSITWEELREERAKMKKKCPVCGDEHECRRETCRECMGYGSFYYRIGDNNSTSGVSGHFGMCNRCGGTGYEPEEGK